MEFDELLDAYRSFQEAYLEFACKCANFEYANLLNIINESKNRNPEDAYREDFTNVGKET